MFVHGVPRHRAAKYGSWWGLEIGNPSAFLALAGGAIAAAAGLKIAGKHDWAMFVGQWAAPFLLLGIYNKQVKQLGSDALSRQEA